MSREIPNQPHRTPNPDGPHNPSAPREKTPVPSEVPEHLAESEDSPYDSCFDDLNVILDQSIQEPVPDPALGSKSASKDAAPAAGRKGDQAPPVLEGKGKEPRTSEVFKAVAHGGKDVARSVTSGEVISPGSLLGSNSPDPESEVATASDLIASAGSARQGPIVIPGSSTDDGDLAEARFPWMTLLLLSYSTAVTLGLTWFVVAGLSARHGGPPSGERGSGTEVARKDSEQAAAAAPLPPIPAENIVRLNRTIRIGDLEITPLTISLLPVELVRSIDPPDYRREEADSLVLRIRLANVSSQQAFAPLEAAFVREQSSPLDRCLITTSRGGKIASYSLAADSEWTIYGQDFVVLEPGASADTILASEPGAASRLEDELTWRVRLRIGPYRSDVVGVRFTANEVERPQFDSNP
jgi:hypothetical protein